MRQILFWIFIFCNVTAFGQQVYQWRGTNRDGVYNEPGLLTSWPEAGPTLLWEFLGLGNGYGSVTASTDKIFVNGEIDSISYLFAFDPLGTLLWKAPNGAEFMGEGFSSSFPGSRSTPTVVDELVYVCSAMGRIACYETNSGAEKWAINMKTDLNGKPNYFGYSESLLVDENKIFCFPGGKDTNMVALDRFNGSIIWVSKALSDTITYCSPMLIKLPSVKLLVTFSGSNLLGFNAQTGELLWSNKQDKQQFNHHCNTPIYHDGYIYYVTSYGNGAVKLELSPDGSNIKEVWRAKVSDNGYSGLLLHNQKLYTSTHKIRLSAIDLNSGEVADSLRLKIGTLLTADSMLYCYSDNGDLSLIDITDEKMKVISKFKIVKGTKEHFSYPSIKSGILYIRHGNALLAYKIKEE